MQDFSKGMLNIMKKNAKSDNPFSINKQVRERLDNWDKAGIEIN
jgi:hypothetical protein